MTAKEAIEKDEAMKLKEERGTDQERAPQNRQVATSELLVLSLAPIVILLLTVSAWLISRYTPLTVFGDFVALIAVFLGGWPRFRQAARDVNRRRITVNVFVAVAIAASLLTGQFVPAAVIIFIMSVAGALESLTVKKTRQAIQGLADLTPKTARVLRDGQLVEIPTAQVERGDIAVVITGERIPVDGHIVEGAAAVNQAPVTGESMPIDKVAGDAVFAGTLNEAGSIRIAVDKVGMDTTIARIIHLVEEAQERKAPISIIADRFTAYFLPAVLFIAIAVFVATGSITRAVSVLLVACPCALAIATPSAVTAGIANLARKGVLVKGGSILEIAGKINAVVLDKTGTTTLGRPFVYSLTPFDSLSEEELIALAASAEVFSEHPIASAILDKAKELDVKPIYPEEHKVIPGRGVIGTVAGKSIVVGSLRYARELEIELSSEESSKAARLEEEGLTVLLVASEGRTLGLISIGDRVRSGARRAVDLLRKLGIRRILLFTGDNARAARNVASQIGVDEVRSELLPEDKLRQLMALKNDAGVVAMVGDGINDAPALAEAHVGVAMGAAGTDVAMEAADICLMEDDLARFADTINFSRTVSRRIKLNIFLSMVYNAVGIALSSKGILNPIPAVLYQELGCISVIVSSTLLLFARPDRYRRRAKEAREELAAAESAA